jgi:hypothetical protein
VFGGPNPLPEHTSQQLRRSTKAATATVQQQQLEGYRNSYKTKISSSCSERGEMGERNDGNNRTVCKRLSVPISLLLCGNVFTVNIFAECAKVLTNCCLYCGLLLLLLLRLGLISKNSQRKVRIDCVGVQSREVHVGGVHDIVCRNCPPNFSGYKSVVSQANFKFNCLASSRMSFATGLVSPMTRNTKKGLEETTPTKTLSPHADYICSSSTNSKGGGMCLPESS